MDEYIRLEKKRAYRKGYMEGYRRGVEDGRNGKAETQIEPALLDRPIQFLNLSTRPFNSLDRAGCRTIRDVVSLDQEKIGKIRGLGAKGLREIAEVLWDRGIRDTEWDMWRCAD
jgi:DNA-directed RNA polymerase alpha subunit